MEHLFLALHLIFVVFAIGPLVHAATTASRGVKNADAAAVQRSARTVRIYGFLSILAALFGFALVQPKYHHEFGNTWVWVSVILYVVAIALVFALILPSLNRAASELANGTTAQALTGRVAAVGGVVAVLFAAIVVLMVYKPGK
jgi:uncharacterized membrane protein